MVGSPIDAIIIPITMVICLAFPIAMVMYADAHPRWKGPGRPAGRGLPGRTPSASGLMSRDGHPVLPGQPTKADADGAYRQREREAASR